VTKLEKLKHIRVVLPFIGIGIFIYIIHDIGVGKIWDAFMQIKPIFLLFSFMIFFPRIALSTYKWQMIARKQGINVKLLPLIKINLIGLFYGTVTPLWLGDWVRIFYLKDESKESIGKCASNVIIDQLIEFFSLFILALFGSVIIFRYFPSLFLILISLFIIFILIAYFFKEKERSKRFLKVIYKAIVPERLKGIVANEFEEFYKDIPPFSSLLVPFVIEIFSYCLFFIQIYIVALSFSIKISPLQFILIYPISSLIGMIPITVSGLGTREGALIHLFAIYGIEEQIAVAISLTGYLITYLIPSIMGGILSIMHESRPVKTTFINE